MYKKGWCLCKLVVSQSKPIAFLPFSLLSPLLKLPDSKGKKQNQIQIRAWTRFGAYRNWAIKATGSLYFLWVRTILVGWWREWNPGNIERIMMHLWMTQVWTAGYVTRISSYENNKKFKILKCKTFILFSLRTSNVHYNERLAFIVHESSFERAACSVQRFPIVRSLRPSSNVKLFMYRT